MLNKLNQANLQMEFTKAFELKALSNIAPRFLTLLADDVSIESILILLMVMVMGFLRIFSSALNPLFCPCLVVIC